MDEPLSVGPKVDEGRAPGLFFLDLRRRPRSEAGSEVEGVTRHPGVDV
ncbi:MAG: hypothetical protein JNK04_15275 [Myxococcales bacterium]|nr:hypothetical protein [Myxococcales bacterium]